MPKQFTYGSAKVPYVVAWSSEVQLFVATCPHVKRRAVCQESSPGEGKPLFKDLHMNRQRECVRRGLCSMCGKSIKDRSKVSLTDFHYSSDGLPRVQTEPLMHKHCAYEAVANCPHLRTKLEQGRLTVTQVSRYSFQDQILRDEVVLQQTGTAEIAVGHAKVCLEQWERRDFDWLIPKRQAKRR